MACVTDVATLIHNRARTREELGRAIEGIRSYVTTRNDGVSFSKKLADLTWRDAQINDLFLKMQSGTPFFELTDHPLLRKLVKRRSKNDDNLAYIRQHIVPCFLDSIKAEPHERTVDWLTSLHGAFIDPANLQHQRAIGSELPPLYAERLLNSKKTISLDLWKLVTDGLFKRDDILFLIELIHRGEGEMRRLSPDYFSVLCYRRSFKTDAEKEALILSIQGAPYPLDQLVDRSKLEAITEEFREACLKKRVDSEMILPIAKAIGELNEPNKSQYLSFFAFRYLRLINDNAPYQSKFYESTVFGLKKLSEDPKLNQP